MFEIIGMAVVAWFAWQVAKAIIAVSIKRTLQAARHQAARLGSVPFDASADIIAHPDVLKNVRKGMARSSRDFAALDVSEQYGRAIIAIHQANTKAADVDQVKDWIGDFLVPQMQVLEEDFPHFLVNPFVFAYVGALAISKTNQGISYAEIKKIVEHVFNEEKYRVGINNAWGLILQASDNDQRLASLFSLAAREVAANKGEYLVNLAQESKQRLDDMFTPGPRRDLRESSESSFQAL